uniref:Zinc finger protein 346 n=2 Tax=Lygus hesperus TaxID=30085 RepID=A0A0A9X0Z3_LYGHE
MEMADPAAELPTVATIIGCPETLSDTNGLVATPLGVPSADGSEDNIQKVLLENMCSSFISKKDRAVMYCDVCEVTCTGDKAYEAHMSGSKHAKKMKDNKTVVKLSNEPFIYEDPYTNTFECTLCQVTLNAKNQIAAHVSGIKHKNRLTPNEKIYSAAPRQMPYRQDMSANLLYCPTCDVHANSDLQMEQHMASAKHVNKVNSGGAVAPNRRSNGPPGPPGRFMPYGYRDRDPRDFYEYDDYDRREYYRGERDYDYEYPRGGGGGGGYWSRERIGYMEERIRDYYGPPAQPRGPWNHYARGGGPGPNYGNRLGYGERYGPPGRGYGSMYSY